MGKKPFSIAPSTNVMDVFSNAGYTLDFALADLLDNSIANKAKNIKIFFNLKYDTPYLYILDDGDGMSREELKKAATPGYKNIDFERNVEDLGRFSIGLKAASHSFSNNLIIASKKLNSTINCIQIDFNYINNSKRWEAFELDNFELSNKIVDKGTMIYCDNLNFIGDNFNLSNMYIKLDELEKSLSHIFGKYILEDNLNIEIQTSTSSIPIPVKGWNPFNLLENKSTRQIYKEDKSYKNDFFTIKIYILPVYNNLSKIDQDYMKGKGLNDQQGFYIYRNRRLISEGGWLNLPGFSIDDKCSYARIEVEIPISLDEFFKVNFIKNSIIIPDDLLSIFNKVARTARSESKKNYNYIKHPEFKRKPKTISEDVWKISNSSSGMKLTLNGEHTLIKNICRDLSEQKKKQLFLLITKSLPINLIQTQNSNVSVYSKKEILELIESAYLKFRNDGMSIIDIKKRMINMEPFKTYNDQMIEFFGNLEDNHE